MNPLEILVWLLAVKDALYRIDNAGHQWDDVSRKRGKRVGKHKQTIDAENQPATAQTKRPLGPSVEAIRSATEAKKNVPSWDRPPGLDPDDTSDYPLW